MTYIYIGTALLMLLLTFIIMFNKFIRLRNLVKEAWSLIDVQLKMRYEVIPNLVATVKAYLNHEQQLLKDVTSLRAKAMESNSTQSKAISENILSEKLAQLMITIENYPELKADEHFLKLQEQIYAIEDKLQLSRRYYNGAVRNHNIAIESFPSNIIAVIFSFKTYEFFELESIEERKNVLISFEQ